MRRSRALFPEGGADFGAALTREIDFTQRSRKLHDAAVTNGYAAIHAGGDIHFVGRDHGG
jgi:hypothetical protein